MPCEYETIRRAVHDLKNWLSAIQMNCDGALMEPTPVMDLKESIRHIREATDQANRLCEDLLHKKPLHSGKAAATDPAACDVLDRVRSLLDGMLLQNVEIHWDVAPDVPPIADKFNELDRVLLNLLTNSVEALRDQAGRIAVTAQLEQADHVESSPGDPFARLQYLVMEVEDTGSGMDPGTKSRIFDPAFTTKPDGHGLGLASVLEMVKEQNGHLEIDSQPDRGTRVKICLPTTISPIRDASCDPDAANQQTQTSLTNRG